MLEIFINAYSIHHWLRRVTWAGLLISGILLWWIFGGVPPHFWNSLVQMTPQLSQLWASQGPDILIPYLLLLIQALTWAVLWGLLLWSGFLVIAHGQQERIEQRYFKRAEQMGTGPIDIWHSSRESQNVKEEGQGTEQHAYLTFGTSLDPGISRKGSPNEDGILAIQGTCSLNDQLVPFGLFAVADGMGGLANGQDASHLATRVLMETILTHILTIFDISNESVEELLIFGVRQADQALRQHNVLYATTMGTTLTVALIINTTAYIANVGDSRTYLSRKALGLLQVTKDHSLVAHLVETGKLLLYDIYTHPQRNQIYRCLGDKVPAEVDTFTIDLQEHDTLLLCSDGLWEMVRDPEIARILQQWGTEPTRASAALLQAALDGGGADNISAIVVHIPFGTHS